jgi:1-acyl-sn-glycerol-3-phosphate acyltransferase
MQGPAMSEETNQLDTLTRINIEDLLEAFGLAQVRRGQRMLEWLTWLPARRFARQVVTYDRVVGEQGLQAGARWILRRYVQNLQIEGQKNVPLSGPVLILCNHPGLTDTMAMFASLPRPNLRVVAVERPFLRALPNMSRQLIYVPDDPQARLGVVRAGVSHLRQGGALLTFPAGRIEPDPDVLPGAVESLQTWSASVALFVRLAPQTQIVPAIIRGVLAPASLRNPLTRLRREQKDRERLAATLQILLQSVLAAYRPANVRVTFGTPIRADPATVMQAVTDQARQLIENPR